jgi:RHS repeat-associated protein
MKLAPGNYQKARRYHWLHSTLANVAPILESEIAPLEGRIFYNYPGQPQVNIQGTSALPTVIARVVKDATGANQTQAIKKEYNAQGNVTKVTDPLGRQTLYEYATNGVDVVTVKQRTGTSGGNPVWTTVTSYTYGSGAPPHRPATVTDGAGQTTSYTYTSTGQVATITNAKSEVTTFTYETSTSSPSYDKLLTITGDVAGGNRTFTYDTYGRMATTTDSESYTLTYDYDALDRVRTITYPDGSTQQYEYEDHSLVASKDRAGRWTRHMYNPNMQRVLTQDPELRMTQQQWCRCGQLKRFVDGNGNITEWQRDEASRVTKKIMPNAAFDLYTYDISGRLSTEVDAMNRTTTYTYNVDDRLAKKDYSDTSTPDVTYSYDTWYPRVTSRVDGAGTTTFTYHPHGASTNGAGQVALMNGPLTDDTQKHTYDQLGRLKKLEIVDDSTQTTASYSQEFTFDARSRVTTVANNLGSTSYAFVGQSNRPSQVDFPNGMQTLYDYFGATGDHLLKQIKNLTAGPTPTVISQFDYTYAADRAVSTWTVDQGSGATTWSFGYDGARQLTSADKNAADGGALVESNTYGYDKAGNRIQVGALDAGAPKNYDVNNLNQLLSERDHGKTTFAGYVDEPATVKINGTSAKVMSTDGGAPYKFEGIVNLDAGTNSVVVEAKDGQNNTRTNTYSVTTTGESKKFEYDANGNLRYEKQPNNTVIREYRWDQQNRLVRFLQGTHESVYEYDGESRRVRIKELTSSVETKNETFVWCGRRLCQKRSGSSVVRSYFSEGFEQGSDDYFYARDHLGSVREVVASNGTTIASRVSYDPWGKRTESGSGAVSDFAFTGHHLDRPTGLNLTWYRGYDASLGRWLSEDPLGLGGGLNVYGYVSNDPTDVVDPLGLSPGFGCILFPWLPWCDDPPPPPPPPPTPPGCHWEVDVFVCAPPPPGGGGGYRGPPGPLPPPPNDFPQCKGFITKKQTQDCCKDACIKKEGNLNFCTPDGQPAMANAPCVEKCLFQNGW